MSRLSAGTILCLVLLLFSLLLSVRAVDSGPGALSANAILPDVVAPAAGIPAQDPATQSSTAPQVHLTRLPLYFVENRGQVDDAVAYYVQGKDKTLYFTAEGVTFVLAGSASPPWDDFAEPWLRRANDEPTRAQRWVVKLDFIGARPGVRPVGEEPTEAVISYFRGPPEEWQAGLRTYARIVYPDLWPGIDLVYSGTVDRLKYEFVVQPGADPTQIRLAYRGATSVAINAEGQLEVSTPLGGFRDDRPVAYQEVDGARVAVDVAYVLDETFGVTDQTPKVFAHGFSLGGYDPRLPLVLDPAVLAYCGYIGGSSDDRGESIAVDREGNAYVAGSTSSSEGQGFPVIVGPDRTYNGSVDAYVAKVSADGGHLVYCAYIGGSRTDLGTTIAVDGAGNAYLGGFVYSTQTEGFPVIIGPDLTHNGDNDGWVAKIAADGSSLVYCGYIGGSGTEWLFDLAVDGLGNAYVTGFTNSSFFPTRGGPDLTQNGGGDAFVAKVKADGSALEYSGYIGGGFDDRGLGITVDGAGRAYVTGRTSSSEAQGFPVDVGPDLTYNGSDDAFVARVSSNGLSLEYCGYIGGTKSDQGEALAVDSAGKAYVTGYTASSEGDGFPVVVGPDTTYNGSGDVFVARVSADGSSLGCCGYVGGTGSDQGYDIAVDDSGSAYITGLTRSSEAGGFPVLAGPDLTWNGEADAFVAKTTADGTSLQYCGYVGGIDSDSATGIAVDGRGNAYVVGYTSSSEREAFPAVVGPDLTYNGGSEDAFVARIGGEPGLVLLKADQQDPVQPYEDIRYTIHLTNTGALPFPVLRITDTLPMADEVAYLISDPPGAYLTASNTLTWTVRSLIPGSAITLSVVLRALPYAEGEVTNWVTVTSDLLGPLSDSETTSISAPLTIFLPVVLKVAVATVPTPTPTGQIPGPTTSPTLMATQTPTSTPTPAHEWTSLSTGFSETLTAVYFVDARTGWITSNGGSVYHTVDGGQNWQRQVSGTTGYLSDIFFLDSSRGWIVGSQAQILRTTDGGQTWQAQSSPVSTAYDLTTVQFVDSTHGWIAAYDIWFDPNPPINMRFYGYVLRTSDGGESWQAGYFPYNSVDDLYFVDANEGWFLSTEFDPSRIDWWYSVYHTSNGGSSWSEQTGSSTQAPMRAIVFSDSNTGWVVGDDDFWGGPVWKTTDGSYWNEISAGITGDLDDIQFAGALDGWIRSQTRIWHTADGGTSWDIQATPPDCTGFNDFHFVDADHGWLVGDDGVVCKYH